MKVLLLGATEGLRYRLTEMLGAALKGRFGITETRVSQ